MYVVERQLRNPSAAAADSQRLDPLVPSAPCAPGGRAASPFREDFMASLGTLQDDVLLEIISAIEEEAHRRSHWSPPDLASDPGATTSAVATAATAAASPMERITDDALLQV